MRIAPPIKTHQGTKTTARIAVWIRFSCAGAKAWDFVKRSWACLGEVGVGDPKTATRDTVEVLGSMLTSSSVLPPLSELSDCFKGNYALASDMFFGMNLNKLTSKDLRMDFSGVSQFIRSTW